MWIGGKRLECVCAPFRCDGGKRATALDEKDGMRGMAKILCIDDDKYLMDLLSYGLTRAGFEVVTECSGRAGLGALYEGRVDLVILAVNIPDMNGFKILTALRAFSQVPVIMLTARPGRGRHGWLRGRRRRLRGQALQHAGARHPRQGYPAPLRRAAGRAAQG